MNQDKAAGDRTGYRIVRKRVASLKPSPENTRLYRAADDDPDVEALADSIRKHGLREPLVVTADGYIVSGHRRYAALCRIGQGMVPCRVLPVRRGSMDPDAYLALLREHNRQREKTVAEKVREELVDTDPEAAHQRLREQRAKSVYAPEANGVEGLAIEGKSQRYHFSEDKGTHIKYAKKVVFEDRRKYWPLSVRGVHYALLNYDFVRGYYWPKRHETGHGRPQERRYKNDDNSYDATSDLITRLRLCGVLPWEAFEDSTRPLKEYRALTTCGRSSGRSATTCSKATGGTSSRASPTTSKWWSKRTPSFTSPSASPTGTRSRSAAAAASAPSTPGTTSTNATRRAGRSG
jgi:hypothetical protein